MTTTTTHPIITLLGPLLTALGRGPDVDDDALAATLHALHARLSESDAITRRHLREAAQEVGERHDHADDRAVQAARHRAAQAEGTDRPAADRTLGEAERARRARRVHLARLVSDATLVAQRVRRGEWARDEGVGVYAVPGASDGLHEQLTAALDEAGVPTEDDERELTHAERVAWLRGLADAIRDERDAALEEVERLRAVARDANLALAAAHKACDRAGAGDGPEGDVALRVDELGQHLARLRAQVDEGGVDDEIDPLALARRRITALDRSGRTLTKALDSTLRELSEARAEADRLRAQVAQHTTDRQTMRDAIASHRETQRAFAALRDAVRAAVRDLDHSTHGGLVADVLGARDALAAALAACDPTYAAPDTAGYTHHTQSTAEAERSLGLAIEVESGEVMG